MSFRFVNKPMILTVINMDELTLNKTIMNCAVIESEIRVNTYVEKELVDVSAASSEGFVTPLGHPIKLILSSENNQVPDRFSAFI